MPLDWIITTSTKSTKTSQQLHQANSSDTTNIQHGIGACIEKAITLLPNNINDDSLYFLVEWCSNSSTLSVVVTDDSKQKESPEVTSCSFSMINASAVESIGNVKYWVKDYLTTSAGFIQFSLVAVFGLGNRDKVELL
ncbi:MAG: hypothetical protein ACI9D5_001717 [Candidatus Endobugula sp.]|jgi:hypothetical protein